LRACKTLSRFNYPAARATAGGIATAAARHAGHGLTETELWSSQDAGSSVVDLGSEDGGRRVNACLSDRRTFMNGGTELL
jgi:hypothetical protein